MGSETLEYVRKQVYYTICGLPSSRVIFFSESPVEPNKVLCKQ